eukprot:859608-Amphidinium_carterae.1
MISGSCSWKAKCMAIFRKIGSKLNDTTKKSQRQSGSLQVAACSFPFLAIVLPLWELVLSQGLKRPSHDFVEHCQRAPPTATTSAHPSFAKSSTDLGLQATHAKLCGYRQTRVVPPLRDTVAVECHR